MRGICAGSAWQTCVRPGRPARSFSRLFPNCKQTLKGSRPMNKILVAVFDTETAAYEGLSALK